MFEASVSQVQDALHLSAHAGHALQARIPESGLGTSHLELGRVQAVGLSTLPPAS